jgi:hypothetical protein
VSNGELFEHGIEISGSVNGGKFLDQLSEDDLPEENLVGLLWGAWKFVLNEIVVLSEGLNKSK